MDYCYLWLETLSFSSMTHNHLDKHHSYCILDANNLFRVLAFQTFVFEKLRGTEI